MGWRKGVLLGHLFGVSSDLPDEAGQNMLGIVGRGCLLTSFGQFLPVDHVGVFGHAHFYISCVMSHIASPISCR